MPDHGKKSAGDAGTSIQRTNVTEQRWTPSSTSTSSTGSADCDSEHWTVTRPSLPSVSFSPPSPSSPRPESNLPVRGLLFPASF